MRLLCIDDDADLRTILELALASDPGVEAEVTGDPDRFVARATESKWDAFVLDSVMPGADGLSLCRTLKSDARTSPVPVIFLTAWRRPEEIARALTAGGVACLEKPFDPMSLTAEIRAVLATR